LNDSTGLEVGPLSGLKLLQAISTGDFNRRSYGPFCDPTLRPAFKANSQAYFKKSDNLKSNIRLLIWLPTSVEDTALKSLRFEI
jgi:hypothetical protein